MHMFRKYYKSTLLSARIASDPPIGKLGRSEGELVFYNAKRERVIKSLIL